MINDNTPNHLKFGYARNAELREITKELIENGAENDLELFFNVKKEYDHRHKDDLTFTQKQDLAKYNNEKWVSQDQEGLSTLDKFREALELIKNGHNDPRTLAREVLNN